jgi:hypothetical protein
LTSLAHRFGEAFGCDASLGDHLAVEQDDRDAPVVEVVQAIVGVDVGQLGFMAKGAEQLQSLVTEMAALTRDQDERHNDPGSSGRQPQLLPRLDGRAL